MTKNPERIERCSLEDLETYISRCKAMIRDAKNDDEKFFPTFWLKDFKKRAKKLREAQAA